MHCGVNVFIVLLPWNLNSHLDIHRGMQLSQENPEPGFCPVPTEGTNLRGSCVSLCNKNWAKLPPQSSAGLKHCRGPVKSFSREIFSLEQHQSINQVSKYQSGISSQKQPYAKQSWICFIAKILHLFSWQRFTPETKRWFALRISSSVELTTKSLLDLKKITNPFKIFAFHFEISFQYLNGCFVPFLRWGVCFALL